MASFSWTEEDVLRCCGSKRFAKELASTSPFSDLHHAIQSANGIWFNKVTPLPPSSLLSITLTDPFPHLLILQIDVAGWLEAFAAHPPIESISPSVSQSLFFQSLSFLFLFWNPFNFLLLAGLGGSDHVLLFIARNIDLGEDEPLLHDSGVEDRVARQEVDSRAFLEVTEDARQRFVCIVTSPGGSFVTKQLVFLCPFFPFHVGRYLDYNRMIAAFLGRYCKRKRLAERGESAAEDLQEAERGGEPAAKEGDDVMTASAED
ncbi:hypothetical protein ZIOFF_071190 [Zingiber officinale]|uniref:Uncharacterized protein n=1 Tax=Zingiber officinale TaxID=94328 RepID=A0A8J5EQB2_ZINOF|nr:hypothetical protein ZIOFF_071190 [Zingiber officinale]